MYLKNVNFYNPLFPLESKEENHKWLLWSLPLLITCCIVDNYPVVGILFYHRELHSLRCSGVKRL